MLEKSRRVEAAECSWSPTDAASRALEQEHDPNVAAAHRKLQEATNKALQAVKATRSDAISRP